MISIVCEHCNSSNIQYIWEDENEKWELYECEDCGMEILFPLT